MPKVSIYTLQACPFCARAKSLLDSKGQPYDEIDVSGDWDERSRICTKTGYRTFPQIYIAGVFVGGCDELQALERAGKLDVLLT